MAGRGRGIVLDEGAMRELRAALALTQGEVAELAGITSRTYQAAEAGLPVSAASARAIALSLCCPISALLRPDLATVQARLAATGHAPLPPPEPWGERPDEVGEVLRALGRGDERLVCCLAGPSGIGKTGLARFVAARLDPGSHAGVAWVSAPRNREPEQIADTMLSIAEALGLHPRLPDPRAIEPEALHRAFRQAFWRRRRLLVLDDVTSGEQAEPFLGRRARALALVTTGHRSVAESLGGALVVVGPLSADASLALLEAQIGPDRARADPGGTARLLAALGGVPRTLLVAGRILRQERYTLPGEHGTRRERAGAVLEAGGALFGDAYGQLRERLGEEGWRLLGALSLLEDRPFSSRWAVAVAPWAEPVRPRLAALVDLHMLEEVGPRSSDGERPFDPAAARFALDAQALRVARAVSPVDRGGLAAELMRFAREEARRLAALDPEVADAAFGADYDAWSLCLDRAARAALRPAAGRVASTPAAVPVAREGVAPETRLLPETLAALEGPLTLRHLPQAGGWLTAGLALAGGEDRPAIRGRLLRMLSRWWCIGPSDYGASRALGRESVEAFESAGAADEVALSLSYLAAACFSGLGPVGTLPVVDEAVAHARAAGLSRRELGAALLTSGASRAVAASTRAEWDRAEADLAESAELLGGEEGSARLLRAAAAVSLAVMRRREGRAIRRTGLGAALSALEGVAFGEGIDAVRLAWLRSHLGVPGGGRGRGRPSPRHMHEAILAVAPLSVTRRLVKLGEIGMVASSPRLVRPPDPNGAAPGGLGLTDLAVGTPAEARLGRMLVVLYPVELIEELVDDRAIGLALAFAEHACATDHPVRAMLAGLAAARGLSSRPRPALPTPAPPAPP